MSHEHFMNFFQELTSRYNKQDDIKSLVLTSSIFDSNVLKHEVFAKEIWRIVAADFAKIEEKYTLPYRLDEKTHLYAMDSLTLCDEMGVSKQDSVIVSKLYIVLFLLCSYFDDHVEHRDKFYSKFIFEKESDRSTQEGAVAFSTIAAFYELIIMYLVEANVDTSRQVEFIKTVNDSLLTYTPFFTVERDRDPTVETVLEMKQHNVAGHLVASLADIVVTMGLVEETQAISLKKGLFYVGSLMQMTDDIRDSQIDITLHNANLLNTCLSRHGDQGYDVFATIFEKERTLASQYFSESQCLKGVKLMSLPFYPFCI